jgi:predicted dinucleotide-binding enzyme
MRTSRRFTTGVARRARLQAWCTPPTKRPGAVTEQLIKDAGYEPISAGGLENAGAVEDFLGVIFAVAQAGTGRFWYRFAPPERF